MLCKKIMSRMLCVYLSDLFIDRLIYLIIPGTVLLTLPLHVLRGFV